MILKTLRTLFEEISQMSIIFFANIACAILSLLVFAETGVY